MSTQPRTFLVLDYGSQFTQLITRRLRELGYFSKILPGGISLEKIKSEAPIAVILSGGPASVTESGAPQLPEGFLRWTQTEKIPILGICYGMQLLAKASGAEVKSSDHREYGRTQIIPQGTSSLFQDSKPFDVWMSHGDQVRGLEKNPEFKITALSHSGILAAFENTEQKFIGLQFHPEVTHTTEGSDILKRFCLNFVGHAPDWSMKSYLEGALEGIRSQVGEQKVLCALSGGVDSAVAAMLVHRAIGDHLQCVFIDHGLLRFKERERVVELFEKDLKLPVITVDASERFLKRLEGVEDPEEKRKIIGEQFIREFETVAKSLEQSEKKPISFLVQGTLYPDVIESKGSDHAAKIKSHHNVGGLPKTMAFQLVEPLRSLFKDEVRALGKELSVPESFLKRHPFPGPGLAVRIIGEITKERADILRLADEKYIQAIRDAGLYDKIWQAFAVFLPIKTVGVQGDGRTHDHVIALRAVTSHDGMTADWYPFESQFLADVSNLICNQVKGINRVVYDISSKPPATIEWE